MGPIWCRWAHSVTTGVTYTTKMAAAEVLAVVWIDFGVTSWA